MSRQDATLRRGQCEVIHEYQVCVGEPDHDLGRMLISQKRDGYEARCYVAERRATREELNSAVAISPQAAANDNHSPGIARLPVAWIR